MSEIRKIEKAVERYKKLTLYNPQVIKMYLEEYTEDVSRLEKITDVYLKDMVCNFMDLCSVSADTFDAAQVSLFQKIQTSIEMAIVNYLLNKTCKNISRAELMKTNISEIQTRFMQYKYIL